ncbi:Three prime repair exonuclease 2-like Protein [Tribolium castaneum]|uniref:Three prime repair exonuclease 2-like Protein n=1 Tax=Tribolium castaneum TaxID=7070 RepID=A0A139WK20_TRICA|nr:Three prime repair exonuclease 2-like Protein [Tribolium castaneum]
MTTGTGSTDHLLNLSNLCRQTVACVTPSQKDLETTGLPHLEHNKTRITELCAVSVRADHIELGCFPRVQNKLSLCFNPMKMISPEATSLTGLSNDLLEYQASFSSDAVDVIRKWLEMNQKPICLVAHNGNRFDYPILRAEVEKTRNKLPEDILCLDSLNAFRSIDTLEAEAVKQPPKGEIPFEFNDGYDELLSQAVDEYEKQMKLTPEQVQKINETTPQKQKICSTTGNGGPGASTKRNFGHIREFVSYKLEDVYKRLTSKEPISAHEAEGDVTMLVTCAAVYGEKFVKYANDNSKRLSEIPAMTPGRRIGF